MWKLLVVPLVILALSNFSESEKVTVGIIHYNDIHGQLFPFKKNSDPPEMCPANEENCIGGIRELAGHIKNIKRNFTIQNLDAEFVVATGNLISGENGWLNYLNEDSSWSKHGDLIRDKFYSFGDPNYYKPNFTALGPREFDGGIPILNSYLGYGTSRDTRVLISNINCEGAKLKEETGFCSLVDPFQIINIGDFKIGLIGFVDPKIVHLADPGTLEIENTISALNSTIEFYLSDVNFIVAIGTGSLEQMKSIADAFEKVKLVIYANENDKGQDQDYPLTHNQAYIAKAGMYGSSVGKLVLDIETTTGDITLNGQEVSRLVEVDNSTTPDDYWKSEFDNFRLMVTSEYSNKIISRTKVNIDGRKTSCWTGECTLGDLVADSMVNCAFQNTSLNVPADLIAVWHAGGLGDVQLQSGENITTIDIHKLLPYSSMATLVTITGTTLKNMFIQSATALDDSPPFKWGQFLHVSSGFQVHYTVVDGVTEVSSLKTVKMNKETNKLTYETVEDSSIYYIVIPSTLYNGRNAYWDLPGSFISGGGYADHTSIGDAHTCLRNYLEKMGAMKLGVQNRIFTN